MSHFKKKRKFVHPEEKELVSQVDSLRDQIAKDALEIVHCRLPKLVLHLDALYKENLQLTKNAKNLELPELPPLGVRTSAAVCASKCVLKSKKEGDQEGDQEMVDASAEAAQAAKASMETAQIVVNQKNTICCVPDEKPLPHPPIISCNRTVVRLLSNLKLELLQMIEIANAVKIWIQLNIPQIEDGNNFGVGIQEEAVSELGRAEDSALGVLETISKYHVLRARLVNKALKYPHIEDYRNCIKDLDENQFINGRFLVLDLRNTASILYDMILKNLEKIKKPRGNTNHLSTML